jgi:membrane-bound lytic murein transglycosylase B
MKFFKIVIFSSILLFLSFIKTEDLILWRNNNSLQINDFKALQKDTVKTGKKFLGAISSISIEVITTQKIDTLSKMVVKNYFHRDQSWMMVKNAYVLQHEQIHFNISELYARKIRKSADSLSQKKRNQSANL